MAKSTHDPYAAFRVPEYRRFISGWLIALVGTRIQSVAIGWEVYVRTDDPLALGLVGLVQVIPLMCLAIPAGYLADRFDRLLLTRLSLAGATLTSLGLAALSYYKGPVAWMFGLLFLDSLAMNVGRPARSSILPQMVPRDVFPNAVMWNTSMFQLTSVIGPAIGGFIIAVNIPLAYVICACTTATFIVMLTRIRIREVTVQIGSATLDNLLGGIRFVWRGRLILAAISLDMFAVLLGGAVYLMPIFARDILKVGEEGLGILNAAPAAGAATMALLMAYLPPMKKAGRNLLLTVAGFGVATIIFGFSKSFPLSLAMLFLTGAFDNVSMVIRQTLIQLSTPDHMRGRVSAVTSIFIGASNELGGFESGLVARLFNAVVSVVSGGIGTIVVVLVTAFASPPLRRHGPLHETQTVDDQ